MVDVRKVVLKKVRSGSGQSTYVVTGGKIGTSQLEQYLKSARIPYNKIYFGGGKVYVKIPSEAARIEGIYSKTPVYVDELGQGVSIDPSLVQSQPQYVDELGQGVSIDPSLVQDQTRSGILESAFINVGSRTLSQSAIDKRTGKMIYETSSPVEQMGLHAHTLMSPSGWEYLGSYPGSFFLRQPGPTEIVYETTGRISRLSEEEKGGYILASMFMNPVTEMEITYATGFTGGAITTAIPRIGTIVSSKAGKIAGYTIAGSYVVGQGSEVVHEVSAGEISKAFGTGFQTAGTFGAVTKGWKTGSKYGGQILLKKTDPDLGKAGEIAKSLEGTKSEWVRDPKTIDIVALKSLSPAKKIQVFKIIKKTKSTVFGSTSKQAQHMPGLVRSAKDLDISTPNVKGVKNVLPSVKGVKGHVFDVKPESEIKSFPHSKRPIKAPGQTKITRLDEEMFRSIYGSLKRGNRPGWQGAKDINRFYSASRTLAESRKIQAERSRFFRGRKIAKAEKQIEEIELFRTKIPKITERLKAMPERINEPKFTESYIPRSPPSILSRSYSIFPSGKTSITTISRPPGSSNTGYITGRGYIMKDYIYKPGPGIGSPIKSSKSVIGSYMLTPSGGVPPPPPPLIKPPPEQPPLKIPKMPFEIFGSETKRSVKRGRLNVKFGYTPSLTGLQIGKTISKEPKVSSGLNLRYPVKKI